MASERVPTTGPAEAAERQDETRVTVNTAGWQIRIIQLLTVPGIVLAYYLYLFHEGAVFPACEVGAIFDCAQVSGPTAQYSALAGVPVALIGLIGYVTIFLIIWLKDWLPLVEDNLPEIMVGVTGLGFLFTLFLSALEAFVIGAFCQFCLYSAVIVTVMFGLSISYLVFEQKGKIA